MVQFTNQAFVAFPHTAIRDWYTIKTLTSLEPSYGMTLRYLSLRFTIFFSSVFVLMCLIS